MSIETICQGCSRKLRVADEHAGRKARCPHCRTIYQVPSSVPGATTVGFEKNSADSWYVRTEDGTQYGPVQSDELQAWVREGRITTETHIRQAHEAMWRLATERFSDLPTDTAAAAPVAAAPAETPTANPYVAPRTTGRRARPHRGGSVLALGILGLVCCQFAAPLAWWMGHTDLEAMQSGQLDASGHGMTKAGMILGILGTVLLAVSVALPLLRVLIRG